MPHQQRFLDSEEREVLFGGAAGPGKSSALLMSQLRWVDVPGYAGILFRRTYKDLALPGALMDRAGQWLQPTAAQWDDKNKRWKFPSGATMGFGYLETEGDKYRYQSAEFQEVSFDELTQFQESQYTYLLSRLRRPAGFPVSPRMRSASNPGGIGHEWVYKRFVGDETEDGCVFIPARFVDNPYIDRDQYRKNLEALDPVTRAQLLDGEWIQDSQTLIYPYSQLNLIQSIPDTRDPLWRFVLAADLGASESKPTTAFCVCGYHENIEGVFAVESEKHADMIPYTIAKRLQEYIRKYRGFDAIVIDEGALGKGYSNEFRRRYAIPTVPADKRSKLGYRKLIRGELERGRLMLVESRNKDLLKEMRTVRWNSDGTDNEKGIDNHLTDTLLYAWRACRAYQAVAPVRSPDPGTPEHYRELDRQEELEEMRIASGAASSPFWLKR